MKKIIWLLSLSFVIISSSGQEITRQDADSMLKALDKSKSIERIELLLNLAQFHIFKHGENQVDFDSATVYINQAKELCKSEKSPAADGYLLLTESYLVKEKGKKGESKKMVEQSIAMLEPLNNKLYLGEAYYELSNYYEYSDATQLKKKIFLVQQSIDAFQQAKNLKRKARSLEMLGDLYSGTDDNAKAIPIIKQALAVYDSIKYPNLQGAYVLLGASYQSQGDFGEALFYLLKALKTAQIVNDSTMQLCQIYNQLGRLYQDIGRFDMALMYLRNALEIAQKNNDESSIVLLATNMSASYYEINQSDQALKVLGLIPRAYLNSENLYDKLVVNLCYLRAYVQLKQYGQAQPYHDSVLPIVDKKLVPEQRRCNSYRNVAAYFFGTKNYSKACYYLTKSMDIVKSLNFEYGRIQGLRLQYELDSAQGNFTSAFTHLSMYKTKTDSVSSERKQRQFQVLSVEYEVGMKEDSIKLKDKDILLLTQTNSLQKANLHRTSLVKNVTIGGIILAFIIIGLLYNRYRLKQKTNKKLEIQQAEIEKQNLSLQNLVNEKEWLLKEIHHRVKNNLQVVMSLLNSQSAYIDNETALTAIHDSQHRVHAMSLIHQKLYNSENLSSIDISLYIRELVSYLEDSFNAGQRIRFELAIHPLEMDVSQAVPLGLILNEAITNSIKYAFPDGRSGVISISLSTISSDHYLLIISDNGIGMSDSNIKKRGSLGMSLMKGLSEDLEGNLSIDNENGTTVKISFVYEKNVNRHSILAETFVSNN